MTVSQTFLSFVELDHFEKCPCVGICLSAIIGLGRKARKVKFLKKVTVVRFGHRVDYQHDSSLLMLILVSWLRWYLSGFATVITLFSLLSHSLEEVTVHSSHLLSRELYSNSLKTNYLHKLFGAFLYGNFVYSNPFTYLSI